MAAGRCPCAECPLNHNRLTVDILVLLNCTVCSRTHRRPQSARAPRSPAVAQCIHDTVYTTLNKSRVLALRS